MESTLGNEQVAQDDIDLDDTLMSDSHPKLHTCGKCGCWSCWHEEKSCVCHTGERKNRLNKSSLPDGRRSLVSERKSRPNEKPSFLDERVGLLGGKKIRPDEMILDKRKGIVGERKSLLDERKSRLDEEKGPPGEKTSVDDDKLLWCRQCGDYCEYCYACGRGYALGPSMPW